MAKGDIVSIDDAFAVKPAKPKTGQTVSIEDAFQAAPKPPAVGDTISIDDVFKQPDVAPEKSLIETGSELLQDFSASPVGKILSKLAIPSQILTGGVVKIASFIDPEIQKKLNPTGSFIPNIFISDVIDYATPTPEEAVDYLSKNGFTPTTSANLAIGYQVTRGAVGLAANFFTDPLFLARIGQLTKASQVLRKSGKVSNLERNVIELVNPFTDKTVAALSAKTARAGLAKIPGSKEIAKGVSKVTDPIITKASQVVDAFNPLTGDPAVDLLLAGNAA